MIVGMKLRNGTLMHRELKSKQYIISYALKLIHSVFNKHTFFKVCYCVKRNQELRRTEASSSSVRFPSALRIRHCRRQEHPRVAPSIFPLHNSWCVVQLSAARRRRNNRVLSVVLTVRTTWYFMAEVYRINGRAVLLQEKSDRTSDRLISALNYSGVDPGVKGPSIPPDQTAVYPGHWL